MEYKLNHELHKGKDKSEIDASFPKDDNFQTLKNEINMFNLSKQTGLIKNIKSSHNTNQKLLENGVTIYSKGNYNLNDVSTIDVSISTIATNLSKLCRYSGNTSKFYSVAEHSTAMSKALLLNYGDVKLAMAGLLHDGSEAFINDILYTVKQQLGKDSPYIIIEKEIEKHIYKFYGIEQYLDNPIVKHIDVQICNIELEMYLSNKFVGYSKFFNYKPDFIEKLPEDAEKEFLTQFFFLKYLLETYENKECLCEVGSHKPKA